MKIKTTKLDRARKQLAAGNLPKAVPFDEIPVKREIANQLWPEQYLVNILLFDVTSNTWKPVNQGKVEGETWLGRNNDAHAEIQAACAAHHAAKGNQIEIKRISFC